MMSWRGQGNIGRFWRPARGAEKAQIELPRSVCRLTSHYRPIGQQQWLSVNHPFSTSAASEFQFIEPHRFGDHRYHAKGHRGAGDHRAQKNAEERIENARGARLADRMAVEL